MFVKCCQITLGFRFVCDGKKVLGNQADADS
jgi:hypothetical protein